MRFEKENHKYFTLLEHLEDGPEGVGARITRITPRLRLALYGPITILRQLFIIRRRHIHWQRSNRQLVTRKSGISNLVEKKTQDMETRIIEVKVRLIGQRNQHELHWRFS